MLSDGKGTKQSSEKQIEDFGEEISGARKDALKEVAKSVENVTVQSLIEMPLGKAFKRPNLKKMIEKGAVSSEDALLAQAVMEALVFGRKKPGLTKRMRSSQEITQWAEETYAGIRMLGEILSRDPYRRDKALEAYRAGLKKKQEQTDEYIKKLRGWNPDKTFKESLSAPDMVSVYQHIFSALNHQAGEKIELPLSRVELSSDGQSYVIKSPGKQGALWFGAHHATLEDAVSSMVLAAKLKRGDMDAELPQRQFRIKGVGERYKEFTGRYVVGYLTGRNGFDYKEKTFESEKEAQNFAKEKAGVVKPEVKYLNDYEGYRVSVTNPLSGESHEIGNTFETRCEANSWMDEHYEEVNSLALEAIGEELGQKRQAQAHFYISSSLSSRVKGMRYFVMENRKDTPWPLIKDFSTRVEAESWLKENLEQLETERKQRKDAERNIVYFNNNEQRIGYDWREGKEADAEMFTEAFGFRGVQFGNWTNANDRQEALNQAYDALMDMAEILNISPKVLSLDGELGLAFGARGSGSALAHYEPVEMVINLTKTRGAGSLGHEWFHALDNCLSRRNGVALGYATRGNGRDGMNPTVREAIDGLVEAIKKSDYGKRSRTKGEYWGREIEMAARLFETWMNWKMSKNGESSPFLVSGLKSDALERYRAWNYIKYKAHETALAERESRKPQLMSQEEFNSRPESLEGYPYPVETELESLAGYLQNLFKALSERESATGSIAEESRPRYAKKLAVNSGMSLFDWADMEEARRREAELKDADALAAKDANDEIDRYAEDYSDYLQNSEKIVHELSQMDEGSNERIEMEQMLDHEEVRLIESRNLLEERLRDYFVRNNTPLDAQKIARDMVARVQAEVEIKRAGLQRLKDILERPTESGQTSAIESKSSVTPTQSKEENVKTAGGKISYTAIGHLPDAKEGEFAFVERKFSVTGEFGFTGSEHIRDRGDVAYIFRGLEDYSIEHVFAALEKDGKLHVVHIGMGGPSSSAANLGAIRMAYDAFGGADKIYLVHNHPSGNLNPSIPDQRLMQAIEGAFEGIETEGLIMDTTSGRYSSFHGHGKSEILELPQSGETIEREVARFDKQDISADKGEPVVIRSSQDVRDFITERRFGDGSKLSYLVLSQSNEIVGNFHVDAGIEEASLSEEIGSVALKYGGSRVVIYGNIDVSQMKRLSDSINRKTMGNIKVLDILDVESNVSGVDNGYLYESTEEYATEVHDDGDLREDNKKTPVAGLSNRVNEKQTSGSVLPRAMGDSSSNAPDSVEVAAKINKNTHSAKNNIKKYKNGDFMSGRMDISTLDKAFSTMGRLFAMRSKGGSRYTMLRTDKGETIAVRLSDHKANGNNFLQDNADGNLSIVIERNVYDEKKSNVEYTEATIPISVFKERPREVVSSIVNGVDSLLKGEVFSIPESIGNVVTHNVVTVETGNRFRVNAGEQDAGQQKAHGYIDAYESSEEAKTARANELSGKLHTPVRLITTAEEIEALPSNRHKRAKGWATDKGKIAVVVPNNVNVADIENTIVHEIVGHSGLKAFIGADRFDDFLGEVYDHAGEKIKKEIDRRTQAMVDNETDRLTRQKGGGVFASAEARIEAGQKREQFRKEATEEYMADMAGEIGDKGFERMSQEEQDLWGKIKAKVQQFLDKFLRGLKIAKSIKLTDKDLAYILYRSWKQKRNGGNPDLFDKAEDAVMRRKTDWDKNMLSDSEDKKTGISEAGLNPIYPSEAGPKKGSEAALKHLEPSSNHAAKVAQKLEIAKAGLYQVAEVYRDTNNPKRFLTDLSKSLNLIVGRGGSGYRSFELQDGRVMTIRVSNHNTNSEHAKEPTVSIVVKRRQTPNTFRTSEKSKVYEYVYFRDELQKAPAGTLSSIADSLSELLDTGEYIDRTGLARENHSPEGRAVHFRDGNDIVTKRPVMARAMYEKRVASSTFQVREAMQDSMLGLKELYNAIDKASGSKRYIEEVDDYLNSYLEENRMSSLNQAEQTAYERLVIKPMLDEVVKLAPEEKSYGELLTYMMAKHGLERNALMRDRAKADDMDSDKADATDFAGLTGLMMTNDVTDAESQATQLVSDYEAANDTGPLWDKVNAATKATLSKLKEGGLLSKDSHDKIANMYDNYIPLRGWSETTVDEVYGYMIRQEASLRGSVLKTANGRTSIADDPIATILLMGQQAIAQANRNKMKQAFLTYVMKNPSDLVSVNQLWLQKNDVTDEWEPVFASNINEGDDPATVEQKISDFEETMKRLAATTPDKYKSGRQARGIPYKIGNGNLGEHTILVKRGDYTYVVTINGNPRAAQALNGLTNPDVGTGVGAALFGLGEKINHIISPIYTTRNPDFIVGNFFRDAFYGNTMAWIKESPKYAARLNLNFIRMNPFRMMKLISRYNANKLDMNNPIERQFHEFIMNGGETGYTNQADIEKQKKTIQKMLKRGTKKISFGEFIEYFAQKWDVLNGAVENAMRFATYITSRQEGRTILRSIYDAKEISVNFNKKGAGAKFMGATGQTTTGNAAAFVSGTGRGLYVFWNAVVQASTNFFRNTKRHPYKMTGAMASMFLIGAIQAIIGASDDDNEETNDQNRYFDQPDFVRRSNLLLRIGNQYLAHPLPHEYLSVFGMGEMAATLLLGKDEMSAGEIAINIANVMSEFTPMPIDRAGFDHALVPSSIKPLYEATINESWTGMPIYKSNPFNKDMPEWTKAYSSANHQLVNLSELINAWSGGDKYTKGYIDFNPAKIEYMLNGYLGGYFKLVDRMMKVYETARDEREFEWRNMPLANRVIKQGDERTAARRINNDFFEYMNDYEILKKRIRNYEK